MSYAVFKPLVADFQFAIINVMQKKGFSLLGIILIVAAVVLIGASWYYFSQRTADSNAKFPADNGTVINQNSMAIDTSSWKTCTNDQYGYSIKYPPNWTTWEQAQNWGRDQSVNCGGKWSVTFAPSNPASERVGIAAYPQATNTRLPDGGYYIQLPKYGNIGNPFGGYNSVNAYLANYVSSSAAAAPNEIHQDALIDGERAVWILNPDTAAGGASSMTVYHNGTFYYVDYSFDKPISSTDTDYLYFQAMAESFHFVQ
jgi:hypothetical protein